MHAIIETGGKQYKVAEGDVLFIEKLPQEAGDAIKFDKVLAILGDAPKFGAPVVEGASVDASVVKNGKGTGSKCTALAWRKTRAQMKNEDRQEE